MKRLSAVAFVIAFALAFAIPSHAQTVTYSSNTPFYCRMASAQPLTSFEQFDCVAINYDNPDGTLALSFYFNANTPERWFNYYRANPLTYGEAYGAITGPTAFTLPVPLRPEPGVTTIPGQFTFNFTVPDRNGLMHTGTVTGTWMNYQVCGGRGCYWWAPKLLSNSITVN
jgi:hypothetical protein